MQICANVFIAWKFIILSKLPYPPFSQSFPTQSNLSCFSCLCLSLSLGLCWHCFLLECSCHNLWQLSAFMWQAMCPNYSRSFPPPAFSPSTLQQLWCIWFADWPSATAVKAAVALSLSLSPAEHHLQVVQDNNNNSSSSSSCSCIFVVTSSNHSYTWRKSAPALLYTQNSMRCISLSVATSSWRLLHSSTSICLFLLPLVFHFMIFASHFPFPVCFLRCTPHCAKFRH